MSEQSTGSSFPRRDAEGRIVSLAELVGLVLAGVVVGVLALLVFDWAFALIGAGTFGRANGWLAVILPAWVFVEEFRAAERGPARIAGAVVGAAVGITAGLLVAGLAAGLPPLLSGALAAAVFAGVYAVIWFVGVRWLAGRTG
ncbi:hypothetical protein [Plantactinospora sp. CA-290183]|uniref:hypothetical protein n=1 Tax=Plantactinospora sp. CA-290183 TaxID=3240006 RepID=UPI003D8C79E2